MKPTQIPVAHRGLMSKHINGRGLNDAYTKSLKNPNFRKEVKQYGLPLPFVVNKKGKARPL